MCLPCLALSMQLAAISQFVGAPHSLLDDATKLWRNEEMRSEGTKRTSLRQLQVSRHNKMLLLLRCTLQQGMGVGGGKSKGGAVASMCVQDAKSLVRTQRESRWRWKGKRWHHWENAELDLRATGWKWFTPTCTISLRLCPHPPFFSSYILSWDALCRLCSHPFMIS